MSEKETTKPEIIIDDDWKSRAQAEKEQLQRDAKAKQKQPPTAAAPDEPAPRDEPAPASPEPQPEASTPLPPASFSFLVTSLATQALATLGQIPGEDGMPVLQLDHAKHFVDTLAILEEKTKGNLTSDESAMLESVLHQLRLLYVAARKQSAAGKQPPSN
ncbi:MAG: DUF1844 domain-containing protein [Planctomycetota bacterium]